MRRTPLTSLLLVVVLTVGALILAPGAASARPGGPKTCTGGDDVPTRSTAVKARKAVLCLLNRERLSHGLKSLRSERRLRRAAAGHSANMARTKFFDHTSPSGATMADRIKRAGYVKNANGWAIGENIAWGIGSSATPREIVKAWMRSPGHRANILSSQYRQIGIGIVAAAPVRVSSSGLGATYTTDFGVRR